MSLFTVSIIVAGVLLVFGVIAIVRGKLLAGFLAILLAIAIAGFGFREDILGDDDPTPSPTVAPQDATPTT